VELQVTVDRPAEGWSGHVGVITTLFPRLSLRAAQTFAVVTGPPIMYRFVLLELLGRGIPLDHILFSLERRMKCGVGKCGHCQINGKYCCQDGPVFTYPELKVLWEATEAVAPVR
jgi:NAD(P)H-flavin reductase